MAAPDERSRRGPDGPDGRGDRERRRLLTSGEVARLFGVDPKTVARWADTGRLRAIRTLGGHRRFRPEDVERLLAGRHDVGSVHADPRSWTRPDEDDGSEERAGESRTSSRPAAG